MKTVLNCDDIFERLTAGPVPQGSEAAQQITEHIRDCESCRDFANAMRPALHLIHESLPQEQREGLPAFVTDEVAIEKVMRHVRTVPQETSTGAKTETKNLATSATTMKSVLGLAAGLVCILMGPWLYESQVEARSKPAHESLAAMNLPVTCFDNSTERSEIPTENVSTVDGSPLQLASSIAFDCCTRCHSERSETRIESSRMGDVLLACHHCHPDV